MKQTAMQQLLEEVILEREKSISVEFREALDFVITRLGEVAEHKTSIVVQTLKLR